MTQTRRDDEGSILIAMLAVLMVTGLVMVLYSTTISSIRQTASDREFQTSILAADAGVQQALAEISFEVGSTESTLSGSGTIGGVDYTWTADRVGNRWDVTSNGGTGSRARLIESEITKSSRFLIGAFADVAFVMRGSNVADSYSAASGLTNTGYGSIGSNGTVDIVGGAFADLIYLYGDAACFKAGCTNSGTSVVGEDTPFDIDAYTQDIEDEIAAECGTSFTGWTASTGTSLSGGNIYCFNSMNFDTDVTLSGASASTPVIIYVTGDIDSSNGVAINCASCTSSSTPAASALQIYSSGSSITLGNHLEIAAAIAAPRAACQGSPSNAQAQIFGAMVCRDLSNQGGWNFHFDTSLLDLSNGQWDVTGWREEQS